MSSCVVCGNVATKLTVFLPCECSHICRDCKEVACQTNLCPCCNKPMTNIFPLAMYVMCKASAQKTIVLLPSETLKYFGRAFKWTFTNPFVN